MKMPKADPVAVAAFRALLPDDDRLVVRPMFGQPAAFLQGNIVAGVFGSDVFVRLPEREGAVDPPLPGARPFAPMAGHAMRGYFVLPSAVLADRPRAREWMARAVAHVATMPPKGRKAPRATAAARPSPRARSGR
jgi:hypothetical protein